MSTQYVRVRSWHISATMFRTLCGLTVVPHPVEPGEHQAQGWSTSLPPGKTCESCLRAHVRAETPQDETVGEGAPG